MKSYLTVLALGGNSFIKDKNHIALSFQYEMIQETAKYIAELIAEGIHLVITHGNGPQVGFLYRRGELSRNELPLIPLDICGADTQGAMGYMIEKALLNEFQRKGINKKVASIVTQTIVDKDDRSFKYPTKPIGSFMSGEEARLNKMELGWEIAENAGRGYRRVVPSPIPKKIIELDVIELLVKTGYIVIAAGGGGIPVILNEQGEIEGVEAVIDKDFGSSIMAKGLGADTLIISTTVDAVYLNFGQEDPMPLSCVSLAKIKRYLEEGHFKPGSMKPKIEAVIQFLKSGGEKAIITSPDNLLKAVKGEAGTTITKD
jgi:carbamate kinase